MRVRLCGSLVGAVALVLPLSPTPTAGAADDAGRRAEVVRTADLTVRDTVTAPELSIGRVDLLRKEVSRLRLVRGVWTTLEVEVHNGEAATAEAEGLRVTGTGRGLKVRPSSTLSYPLSPGSRTGMTVQVKLTGKKPGRLALTARSASSTGTRTLPVTSAKPAKRPAPGKYSARTGKAKVDFRIKNGRVTNFRTGPLSTRCGRPGAPFTYTTAHYRFPKARIGRDGLVNVTHRTDKFVMNLQMKAVGKRVTQGYFNYYGPAGCYASVEFQTRRK